MSRVQQGSFSSLVLENWAETDTAHNVLQQTPYAGGSFNIDDKKSCGVVEYFPFTFEDVEVRAMIAEWEALDLSHTEETSRAREILDEMDPARDTLTKDVRTGMLDPIRRMSNPAPPKKFKRASSSARTEIRRSLSNPSVHTA